MTLIFGVFMICMVFKIFLLERELYELKREVFKNDSKRNG